MVGMALTLALAACAHQQETGATTTSASIPTTAEPQPSKVELSGASIDLEKDLGARRDGRVTNAIYAGMLADDALRAAAQEVDVTTHDGNVVLRGRVRSDAQRAAIVRKARATDGVKNVDDRLRVSP